GRRPLPLRLPQFLTLGSIQATDDLPRLVLRLRDEDAIGRDDRPRVTWAERHAPDLLEAFQRVRPRHGDNLPIARRPAPLGPGRNRLRRLVCPAPTVED